MEGRLALRAVPMKICILRQCGCAIVTTRSDYALHEPGQFRPGHVNRQFGSLRLWPLRVIGSGSFPVRIHVSALPVFSISVHTGGSTPFTRCASVLFSAKKTSGEKSGTSFEQMHFPVPTDVSRQRRGWNSREEIGGNFEESRVLPGLRSRLHLVSMYHGFYKYATRFKCRKVPIPRFSSSSSR